MTEENINAILNRLNEMQDKNDADHNRVEVRLGAIDRRMDAVDRQMERLWKSTNEEIIQINQKLQDQGRLRA